MIHKRVWTRINRATVWRKRIPGNALVAAALIAVVAMPVSGASTDRAAGDGCDRDVSWKDVPASVKGDAGITSLKVTSASGDLRPGGTLYVRVDTSGPKVDVSRLLIDTDEDWTTGMWTAQSDLSAAGWDVLIDPWAGFYRHAGNPREWNWKSQSSGGVEVDHPESGYRYCISVDALSFDGSKRIRVTAENEEISLPLRFLPGVPFPHADEGTAKERVEAPGRMAFNYSGAPWLIRHCATKLKQKRTCAARVYSKFSHLILGARLEEADRAGHRESRKLIRKIRDRSPSTEIWGYISIVGSPKDASGVHPVVYSVADYLDHVAAWKDMGVTGIFVDEYDICDPSYEHCQRGPAGDVEITREHQQAVVEGIHGQGLAAFVNGNSPLDAMAPYEGEESPLGDGDGHRLADMYLLENPTVLDGGYHTGIDFEANLSKFLNVIRLKQETGVRIGVLDSMPAFIPDTASTWDEYRLGWWRAAQANADGYAFFGPLGHSGNVPVLSPPPDAITGYVAEFEADGVEALSNGWETRRYVADCTGNRVGSVTVQRISKDGTAVGGFFQTGTPDPSC